jgi:flagellar basal-body rod protein FlgB
MIDALFSTTNYVATKKMLDATALRHEAIASNLANLETPGYKRIDLSTSFQNELQQALGTQDTEKIDSLTPSLSMDTTATTMSRDGNNVQLETELLNLSQNTMAHALETQLVSANMNKLRTAITGKTS